MRAWGLVAMTVVAGPAAAQAPSIAGEWRGTIAAGGGIPLVLHLGGGPGGWTASLDSPAQGAKGLPASVTVEDRRVRVTLAAPAATFEAIVSEDGATLTGEWRQGAASLPLVMTRAGAATPVAAPDRPQTPRPPFPYRSVEVAYDNAAGGSHLAGTLTLPPGKGPHPAVLLITGSGTQDRDETLFGHKPFAVWADSLTRRGVAVLRVDDRGAGGSTGEVRMATTADFAGDVAAGVAYLRSRPEIDPARVGLMGHSEGGVIAPMVAAADPRIAFVVMLAGPGVRGDALLLQQKRDAETAMGLPPAAVDASAATMARLYRAVGSAATQAEADAALAREWRAIAAAGGRADAPMPAGLAVVASPWMRWFASHDPAPVLARLRCPVLAVIGDKDAQVSAAANLPAIRAALAGDRDATVRALPGLNHLFQTAQTGRPDEYARIAETIAPIALTTVGDWIVAHAGPARPLTHP